MKKIDGAIVVKLDREDIVFVKRSLLEIMQSLIVSLSSLEDLKGMGKEKKQILLKTKNLAKEIKESCKVLDQHIPKAEEEVEKKVRKGREMGKGKKGEKGKEGQVREVKELKKGIIEKVEKKKEKGSAGKTGREEEKEMKEKQKTKKLVLRAELEEIREKLKNL